MGNDDGHYEMSVNIPIHSQRGLTADKARTTTRPGALDVSRNTIHRVMYTLAPEEGPVDLEGHRLGHDHIQQRGKAHRIGRTHQADLAGIDIACEERVKGSKFLVRGITIPADYVRTV